MNGRHWIGIRAFLFALRGQRGHFSPLCTPSLLKMTPTVVLSLIPTVRKRRAYFLLTRGYTPCSASGGPKVPLHGCSGADRVAANIVQDWLYVIRVLAKLIQGDNLSRHRNDIVLVSF